ncbi:hypothetical protein ACFWFF_19495 [Streptomyces sp. NPDC060223]|uniref:hypothetical protein n=1 Tax=unclassified Streptomyces TaxID=2593676 RepID=UPI0036298B97
MTDNTPDRPETAPAAQAPTLATATLPSFPTAPPSVPPAGTAGPQGHPRRRALIAIVAVAALLVGGGISWWALADGDDDAMSHVEVSGGKVTESENSLLDEGEECDDTDEFTYNDCDTSTAYEFVYKITNKGDEPANYAVIVNGFDEDGDFVGQSFVSATHLGAGKTDADTGEFSEYAEFEGAHSPSDIASVKVAHVERVALAN